MSVALHRPSASSTRPAYMEQLFRDAPTSQSAHSSISSISTISSTSNYNPRNTTYSGRSLSPPPEEGSDTASVRSKTSSNGKSWFRLGKVLHRRTYPQSEEADRPVSQIEVESRPTTPLNEQPSMTRRPSLPRIPASFPPPQAINTYATRPLPAVPPQSAPQSAPVIRKRPSLMRKASAPALPQQPQQQHSIPERMSSKRLPAPSDKAQISTQELSCQRCYYFTARNCNGYVLGGESGDACEGCLQSGFFGAK
ncbi:uncharacterized protein RCC_05223 [Ramularia collo-cygni]|uniref:Uncharacterized protein n=1 Tax=Ramularia collo-cygni TaxID=112498 RepID=A0A2D3UYE0_9PEZI|nr:uncharacterized protein RCC_05223 [Ramularia collo-cygni]CZT19375.1 uncharacterized protein RCC_05223 [Ramularia collo-cygni]